MTDLKLTEQERHLLLEILERQQRDLSVTARRTDNIRVHQELREQVRTIDRLVERLANAGSPAPEQTLGTGANT